METNQDTEELEQLDTKAMYWDEVSGVELSWEMVAKARQTRSFFFSERKAFRECEDDECNQVTEGDPSGAACRPTARVTPIISTCGAA